MHRRLRGRQRRRAASSAPEAGCRLPRPRRATSAVPDHQPLHAAAAHPEGRRGRRRQHQQQYSLGIEADPIDFALYVKQIRWSM